MNELLKFISKHSFLILFIFLEGISLILIVQNNSFQKSRFINSTRNITGYFYKNIQGYKEYFKLHETNLILSEENARLRNQLSQAEYRNEHTYDISRDSTVHVKFSYLPARVVNNSINKQYNYITLDAGKKDGIRQDMAVISDQGAAGVIIAVSGNYSLVLPAINRNFRLSAKIEKNNYFGIIEWEGTNRKQVVLREIPVHAEVNIGDKIVTSGYSAIFPEGILVGRIVSVREGDGNFYDLTVELATDFANLYHVNVISNLQQEEQVTIEKQAGL